MSEEVYLDMWLKSTKGLWRMVYLIYIHLGTKIFTPPLYQNHYYKGVKWTLLHPSVWFEPLVKSSVWTSSHFIKVEFHEVWKFCVWMHIEFKENEFFEVKLKFRCKFAKIWLEYLEYFKFYQVWVSQKYKPSNSNFIEFENWAVDLVEFSSFE